MLRYVTVSFPSKGLKGLAKAEFITSPRELRKKVKDKRFLSYLDWEIDKEEVPRSLLDRLIYFDRGYKEVLIEDKEGYVLDVWVRS